MTIHRSRFAVGLLLTALLPGCGPDKGAVKTHDYLVQVAGIVDQLNGALPKAPANVPQMPVIPKNPTAAQTAALKEFITTLSQYYDACSATVNTVLTLCDQAQQKVGALDSEGIDQAAQDLGQKDRMLISQRQQLAANVDALIILQKTDLDDNELLPVGFKLVNAGLKELCMGSGTVTSAADDSQLTAAERSEMSSDDTSVDKAITQWRKDATDAAAARSKLLDDFKAKYPKMDWGFLK